MNFDRGFLRVSHESKSHKDRYVSMNSFVRGRHPKALLRPFRPHSSPRRSKSVGPEFKKAVRRNDPKVSAPVALPNGASLAKEVAPGTALL